MEIMNILLETKKDNPCQKVTKKFAELCSSVSEKVEIMSDNLGYLAIEISKKKKC